MTSFLSQNFEIIYLNIYSMVSIEEIAQGV